MTPAEKKTIFDGLVANGLRHLDRGLSGFASGEYDFAVADACFGIEIVLKALVFNGQWEQIFDNPSAANAAKLKAGTAYTIGLDEALKRLAAQLGAPLPPSTAQFKNLQQHRNKLVHFFHPGLSSAAEKVHVARDLANSWGALRELCALASYTAALRDHAEKFRELGGRLLILDTYLDEQAVTIRSKHPHLDQLEECPACKRLTFDGDCGLCGYSEPSHRELTQGADFIEPADCPKCGAMESVVVSGEGARCNECGRTFDALSRCDYCGEPLAYEISRGGSEDEPGDEVGSFYYGCQHCDGRLGELMSRDD